MLEVMSCAGCYKYRNDDDDVIEECIPVVVFRCLRDLWYFIVCCFRTRVVIY